MRNDFPANAPLPRVIEMAQAWVARCLPVGGTAVDATAGNGHDTVFLARACGPAGTVHAFDLQEEAISATRARVRTAGLDNVVFHTCCHSQMAERLGARAAACVDAVMFNLGYLPGGDKSRITRPTSTLAAVECALALLRPGGLITVVCYPGHPGGAEEKEAVETLARNLDHLRWQTAQFRQLHCRAHPPELIGIARRRE